MTTDDDPEQALAGHRRLGGEAFSAAWTLIEREHRSPDDDLDLLLAAAASRWHKQYLGEPERIWLGDWQVARTQQPSVRPLPPVPAPVSSSDDVRALVS